MSIEKGVCRTWALGLSFVEKLEWVDGGRKSSKQAATWHQEQTDESQTWSGCCEMKKIGLDYPRDEIISMTFNSAWKEKTLLLRSEYGTVVGVLLVKMMFWSLMKWQSLQSFIGIYSCWWGSRVTLSMNSRCPSRDCRQSLQTSYSPEFLAQRAGSFHVSFVSLVELDYFQAMLPLPTSP